MTRKEIKGCFTLLNINHWRTCNTNKLGEYLKNTYLEWRYHINKNITFILFIVLMKIDNGKLWAEEGFVEYGTGRKGLQNVARSGNCCFHC